MTGQIKSFDSAKKFGFIVADNGQEAFFHVTDILEGSEVEKGDRVTFELIPASPRPHAVKVVRLRKAGGKPLQKPPNTKVQESQRLLQDAISKRKKREYDSARNLFVRSNELHISPDALLAHASMEGDLARVDGNYERADRIYEKAVEHFPNSHTYKAYGLLYLGRDDIKARGIFEQGLTHNPTSGVLHYLAAQAIYNSKQFSLFQAAEDHLNSALKSGEQTAKATLLRQLVRIFRAPQARPKRFILFFEKFGFELLEAIQHKAPGYAVDFVVQAQGQDLDESFDVSGNLLFRCLLSNSAAIEDVSNLTREWDALTKDRNLSRDALFIGARSDDKIKNYLYMLIEQPGPHPTVVPLIDELLDICERSANPMEVFKQYLGQWLFRRNLYDETFPVSGRRFFGREQELAELSRNVDLGTPVGLFGLRKVGKTSILNQLTQNRPFDLVAYLDVQGIPAGITDMSFVYWQIANDLWAQFAQKHSDLTSGTRRSVGPSYTDIKKKDQLGIHFDADLRLIRETLRKNNRESRIVIQIDEVERLLPSTRYEGFLGYDKFFAYLRGVSQQDGGIVSIITGANPAVSDTPQWEGRDNPVFKLYREMFLPPLEPMECAEMIMRLGKGMGVSYTENAATAIYQESGGHPFITRQLCSRITKTFKERPLRVDVEKVQQGVNEFLFHDSIVFREILERLERDFPEEKELLLYICVGENKQESLIAATGEAAEALRHLVNYQLVERSNDSFQVKLRLLTRWINEYWLARK